MITELMKAASLAGKIPRMKDLRKAISAKFRLSMVSRPKESQININSNKVVQGRVGQ